MWVFGMHYWLILFFLTLLFTLSMYFILTFNNFMTIKKNIYLVVLYFVKYQVRIFAQIWGRICQWTVIYYRQQNYRQTKKIMVINMGQVVKLNIEGLTINLSYLRHLIGKRGEQTLSTKIEIKNRKECTDLQILRPSTTTKHLSAKYLFRNTRWSTGEI